MQRFTSVSNAGAAAWPWVSVAPAPAASAGGLAARLDAAPEAAGDAAPAAARDASLSAGDSDTSRKLDGAPALEGAGGVAMPRAHKK
jgi:hypothetical protein